MDLIPNEKVDFIGDVHGGYSKLCGLLKKIGYRCSGDIYINPEGRIPCFLGDMINIGNENKKTIDLIRSMCLAGKAACIIGNHEFSIYRYWKSDPDFFNNKLIPKDYEIYIPFFNDIRKPDLFDEIMHWFGTVPVFINENSFTAVHAYWEDAYKSALCPDMPCLTTNDACDIFNNKNDKKRNLIFNIIFGRRISLPNPLNPSKNEKYRYKWWDVKINDTYENVVFAYKKAEFIKNMVPDCYHTQHFNTPVFFGHYWLKQRPYLTGSKLCCLDFGGSKGGFLTSYRFDGKSELSDENLIFY